MGRVGKVRMERKGKGKNMTAKAKRKMRMATYGIHSEEAANIVDAIGAGWRLCVPLDPSIDRMCWRWFTGNEAQRPAGVALPAMPTYAAVGEFVASPMAHRLERENVGQRMGWEVLGLPGETHAVYCLVQ